MLKAVFARLGLTPSTDEQFVAPGAVHAAGVVYLARPLCGAELGPHDRIADPVYVASGDVVPDCEACVAQGGADPRLAALNTPEARRAARPKRPPEDGE